VDPKLRVVQEQVPGRQVTLAHSIANPGKDVLEKLEAQTGTKLPSGALGIMSLTPAEISVIAADLALKSASVTLVLLDIQVGTLFFAGTVSEVDAALNGILDCLANSMAFEVCPITRT
jgi:ethanolamine utilization protein EutS